jgi:hypothetical protein
MTRKRLPSLAAQRILPLLLLAGCATASQRPAIDLGAVEQFADDTADWERIALQADAWPTPGEGGTLGVADRLTDGEKGARVFSTAAGTRAPWTFVFRFRGGQAAPAAVVIETPPGAGCRPSDLSLFLNSTRSTLDRSNFTRFIESSQRVGFAELKGQGGRYLLTLPSGSQPGYLWFRVMQTLDGAPPCIAEVTALASLPPSLGGMVTVALQPIDTAPFQGQNYMGFPDMDGSAAPAEGSASPPAPSEGPALQLLDKSESAFGVKARPADTTITPSTKPR